MLLTTDPAETHDDKGSQRHRCQEAVVGGLKLFQKRQALSPNALPPEARDRILGGIVMELGSANGENYWPRVTWDGHLKVASPTRGQTGQFELQRRHLSPRDHTGQSAVGHDC